MITGGRQQTMAKNLVPEGWHKLFFPFYISNLTYIEPAITLCQDYRMGTVVGVQLAHY